jgi:hypothetical protein
MKSAWTTKDAETGDYVSIDVEAVPLEPSHWFCHNCKAHFGLPVYEKADPSETFLCPQCGMAEIEDNGH